LDDLVGCRKVRVLFLSIILAVKSGWTQGWSCRSPSGVGAMGALWGICWDDVGQRCAPTKKEHPNQPTKVAGETKQTENLNHNRKCACFFC